MDDVRFLPSGNVLVAANVELAGEISISADTESVLGHRDLQDFFGDDPYWVRPRVGPAEGQVLQSNRSSMVAMV